MAGPLPWVSICLISDPGKFLIANESGVVGVDDLDAKLYQKHPSSTPKTLEEIDEHVDEIKKQLVVDTLKDATRAEAARRLGITQSRLHYFITKWELDKEPALT